MPAAAVPSCSSHDPIVPTLFGDDPGSGDPQCDVSCLPVKQAGLAVANPASAAEANYEAPALWPAFEASNAWISEARVSHHGGQNRALKLLNQAKHESEMNLLTSNLSKAKRLAIGCWCSHPQQAAQNFPLLSSVRRFEVAACKDPCWGPPTNLQWLQIKFQRLLRA